MNKRLSADPVLCVTKPGAFGRPAALNGAASLPGAGFPTRTRRSGWGQTGPATAQYGWRLSVG